MIKKKSICSILLTAALLLSICASLVSCGSDAPSTGDEITVDPYAPTADAHEITSVAPNADEGKIINGVIVGKEGWLFEAGEALADYLGESILSEDELRVISEVLLKKRDFYTKSGAKFYLAITPDVFDLYPEYLPDDIIPGETRKINQIIDYLTANTDIEVINPIGQLLTEKANGRVINNTRSSYTDLGSLIVYQSIMNRIGEDFEGLNIKAKTEFSAAVVENNGYELAELLEDTRKYQNISVELTQSDTVLGVSANTQTDNASLYQINENYKPLRFKWHTAVILGDTFIENSGKYFAESFQKTGVLINYNADPVFLNQIQPEIAVMQFSMKSIPQLLAQEEIKTAENMEQSATPIIMAHTFNTSERYVITGKAEEGSQIVVSGGKTPIIGLVTDGMFIVETLIASDAADIEFSVVSIAEGKSDSETVTVKMQPRSTIKDHEVFVGLNNKMHITETISDIIGDDLFSKDELKRIRDGFEKIQQRLIDAGCKTKVVVLLNPNQSTVYPESIPEWILKQKKTEVTKLKQVVEYMQGSTVTVLDTTPILLQKKNDIRLWHRTDTHWNELGGYYGYSVLFDHISKDFPAAKPIPLEECDIFTADVTGGDLIFMLDIDVEAVLEKAILVRPKAELKSGMDKDYSINFQNRWFREHQSFDLGQADKPNIIMYRDSFSTNMMMFMAESSNKSIYHNMWDFNVKIRDVAKENPDYLIIEKVERTLKDFRWMFG